MGLFSVELILAIIRVRALARASAALTQIVAGLAALRSDMYRSKGHVQGKVCFEIAAN